MKIRNGFVTNSSSSSFLIGYNDFEVLAKKVEKGIKDNICEQHYVEPEEVPEYVGEAVAQLLRSRITKGDIQKMFPHIKEELFWVNRSTLVYKGKDIYETYSYKELRDKNSEVNKYLRGVVQKQIAELNRKMSHYKKFIYITVEDHTPLGSTLEHDVLPKITNVIYIEDNH